MNNQQTVYTVVTYSVFGSITSVSVFEDAYEAYAALDWFIKNSDQVEESIKIFESEIVT